MATTAPSHEAIDLSRALSRLEAKITSPPPSLRCSSAERAKTRANLEHARTLLLRLEQANKAKKPVQTQLGRQRALVKKLTEKLHDLETADDGSGEPADDTDDAFALIGADLRAAAPSVAVSEPAAPAEPTATPAPAGLRSRDPRAELLGPSAMTSAHALWSEKNAASEPSAAALQAASSTQAELTSSMLDLAAALKKSAQAFAADLDADSASLSRAAEGLDKSKGGLDATTKGLGVLRRMSEGRWWWGRMILMAGIVALWMVLVLLVFVGPKIRW